VEYSQQQAIDHHQKLLEQLVTQTKDAAKVSAFELQERCAKQAKALFQSSGWEEKDQLAAFANHYEPSLSTCFLTISGRLPDKGKPPTEIETLVV
jgi:hypothetical protein